MTTRICNQCGWAHVAQTREEIETQAREFGAYISTQTDEVKGNFGFGPLARRPVREWDFKEHVAQSEACFRCGNTHSNFRDENDQDHIPMGVTMQGIIKE